MTNPFSSVTGLRLTLNPMSTVWGVPIARVDFRVILIGWVTRAVPVDGGVPKEVAQLLSECLTRVAVVTFLHSRPSLPTRAPNQWYEVHGAWMTMLTASVGVWGKHKHWPLLSTQDAATTGLLFNDEMFDWTQQGQIAFLTENRQVPPTIGYDLVEECFDRKSLAETLRRARPNLLGLLYPAVDGDFAGLISADNEFIEQVLEEIHHACDSAGFSFTLTTEDEFKRMFWAEPSGH
jgi:hypothetical protein